MFFFKQFGTVLLYCLAPYERVLVGFRLYLGAVDVLYVKTDETLFGKKKYQLGEDIAYLILDTVAEVIDGLEVRLLISRQPYEVNVALERFLYFATGVDVAHVGVDDHLQHHPGVIRIAAKLTI